MNDFEQVKKQIDEKIQSANSIMISGHISHDLDAICAMFAMKRYITQKFKKRNVDMYLTDHPAKSYDFLKEYEDINFGEDISIHIPNYDLVILLDAQTFDRFGNNSQVIIDNLEKIVVVDHHIKPDKFKYLISEEGAPSTCSLIYKYFFKSDINLLNKKTAEYLIYGFFFDTDTFRYVNTKWNSSIAMMGELIEKFDLSISSIQEKLDVMDPIIFEIYQCLVKNTQTVNLKNKPDFVYSYMRNSEHKPIYNGFFKSAKDLYLKHILRNIKNAPWGIVVKKSEENVFSISFRSKTGAPDVQVLAEHFGGSGSKRTSGGAYVTDESIDVDEVVKRIVKKINEVDLPIITE